MILNGIKTKDNSKEITLPRSINIPDEIRSANDSDFYFIIMKAIIEAWEDDVKKLETKIRDLRFSEGR